MTLRVFNKALLWLGVVGALSACQRGGSDSALEPLEPSSGEAREEAAPIGGAGNTGEFYEEVEPNPASGTAEELPEVPTEPGTFDTPMSAPAAPEPTPSPTAVEEPAEPLPSDEVSKEGEGF